MQFAMAPPAKRRKRNVVADDEDDENETPPQQLAKKNSLENYFSSPGKPTVSNEQAADEPSPTKRKTTRSLGTAPAPLATTRTRQFKAAATKSASPSPDKRKGQKKVIDEKWKSGNIRTLFSKQAQRVQTEATTNGTKNADITDDDIVSDPISDNDDIGVHKASASSVVGKAAQKRFRETSVAATSSVSTSQRFLKPPRLNSNASVDEDQRPWSERFAPVDLDELVVHKKKVSDVRKWLGDVQSGQMRQRLLILKGAAGTGKTTTVQLLAKDMGVGILEWRNPSGALGGIAGFQSASAQFEEFMGRGGKFGQLEFDEEDATPKSTKSSDFTPSNESDDDRPRLMLIEEFPNTFMRSGSALTSFRRTLLQYLANNTPSLAAFGQHLQGPIIPIVIVISETLLTTTSASADSFTAHRLLGTEILRHPGTGVIEFNDVATTLLTKALELIVRKEARISGRKRTPGPQVLKRLGEIGDIRNAIASLEFLCLKGDDDADWGSKVAFTKPKRSTKDQALTKGEKESLEMISQREASLGIFHAVGKVVYNKREELSYPSGSDEALAETMPEYLAQHTRPKKSQISVETLIDETGTDTATFISALHENYVLSCERHRASDPSSSIDYINECIEYLSESDLLNPSWDSFFGGKQAFGGFGGRDQGSHILRQDEMAFQVAVRGLLFSLPSPVKRQSSSSGRGGDTFKMYYPTSIKLWRTKEELEGLVDLWASKMLKGEDVPGRQPASELKSGASAFQKKKASSVGDWAGSKTELKYMAKPKPKPEPQAEEIAPLLSLGSSARQEMILERLPYMAHITRRRRISFYSMGLRDIEKVVSFQGIGAPATDESDDETEEAVPAAGEAWATDKPTEEATPRKKRTGAIRTKSDKSEDSLVGNLQVNRLVLSDDDIEDD